MEDVLHDYKYDAYYCDGNVFIQNQRHLQSLWKHGSYGKGHISQREPVKNTDILHLTLLESFFLLFALDTIKIQPCRTPFTPDLLPEPSSDIEDNDDEEDNESDDQNSNNEGGDDEDDEEDNDNSNNETKTNDETKTTGNTTTDNERKKKKNRIKRYYIPPEVCGPNLTVDDAWSTFQLHNPRFIEMYAIYHFFRSKGWVPRCGLKYGVDFVVYKKGPADYHADYCVIVKSVNEDYDVLNDYSRRDEKQLALQGLLRMTHTVAKDLLYGMVIIPTDLDTSTPDCLQQMQVRCQLFRRWDAARDREKK